MTHAVPAAAVEIPLSPDQFAAAERPVLNAGQIAVSAFRYASGIEALRVVAPRAELVVLPYFGHQIWRAGFDGRDVTMGSMFEEPVRTARYLETYGAFFIHCGLLGLGAPGPKDNHVLHGELPLAPFGDATIRVHPDGRLEVSGVYRHRVAFTANYRATSRIVVAPDRADVEISLAVENLRSAPMDLLYLGHANFRPVDHGRLDYSAPYTPEAVAVRRSIPAHISPPEGYAEYIAELADNPTLHHVLDPSLSFDPEAVFTLSMRSDAEGWAHGMQTHPDGSADFISYDTSGLPLATRWVCRTADQQGLGIAMPATSGVEGYTIEKAAGRVAVVPGKGVWTARMRMGRIGRAEADALRNRIDRIAGRG